MPNLDEAPREIASTVKQGSTTLKKTHPMIIVAAAAVTIVSAVGVAMMTGILPTAQSKSNVNNETARAKSESSAPLTAAAAGAAAAGVGSMMDAPQTSAISPSDLKPLDSKTVGQPMAKADQSIAAQRSPASPTPSYTERKPTVVAAAPRPVPTPNSANERAPSTNNNQPTPVYAQNSAQNSSRNAPQSNPSRQPERVVARSCRSCGTVDSINPIESAGQGSGAGAVLGGVLGGVLGHQVGGGRGRDVATVAGAVGGAVLGNQVEKNNRSSRSYDVRVRMEDNTFSTVRYNVEPNVRIGDKVRVEEGRLVRD